MPARRYRAGVSTHHRTQSPLAIRPNMYDDYLEVFSKAKASGLPPHRPYDCAIDLLPGTTSPRCWIYPLSLLEQEAMKECIREALEQGYIIPFTSPASASFFFASFIFLPLHRLCRIKQNHSKVSLSPFSCPSCGRATMIC